MARYINPKKISKEAFLLEHGKLITFADVAKLRFDTIPEGYVLVCFVDNGPFTAAGICEGQRDMNEFQRLDDTRPRMFFLVPIDTIEDNAPDDQEGIRRVEQKGELVRW